VDAEAKREADESADALRRWLACVGAAPGGSGDPPAGFWPEAPYAILGAVLTGAEDEG
jgi:hypothetical protein